MRCKFCVGVVLTTEVWQGGCLASIVWSWQSCLWHDVWIQGDSRDYGTCLSGPDARSIPRARHGTGAHRNTVWKLTRAGSAENCPRNSRVFQQSASGSASGITLRGQSPMTRWPHPSRATSRANDGTSLPTSQPHGMPSHAALIHPCTGSPCFCGTCRTSPTHWVPGMAMATCILSLASQQTLNHRADARPPSHNPVLVPTWLTRLCMHHVGHLLTREMFQMPDPFLRSLNPGRCRRRVHAQAQQTEPARPVGTPPSLADPRHPPRAGGPVVP
jgi:hypothetical protein